MKYANAIVNNRLLAFVKCNLFESHPLGELSYRDFNHANNCKSNTKGAFNELPISKSGYLHVL